MPFHIAKSDISRTTTSAPKLSKKILQDIASYIDQYYVGIRVGKFLAVENLRDSSRCRRAMDVCESVCMEDIIFP